jgi:hypothetical protein
MLHIYIGLILSTVSNKNNRANISNLRWAFYFSCPFEFAIGFKKFHNFYSVIFFQQRTKSLFF